MVYKEKEKVRMRKKIKLVRMEREKEIEEVGRQIKTKKLILRDRKR